MGVSPPPPPKLNVRWFSRKNSRFSGKNKLNRVRFTCCSSASTCAKSVLMVTSAVRFCVTPYLTSSPISPSQEFDTGGEARGALVSSEMAYGLTSRFLDPGGASIPTSGARSDGRKPRAPSEAGIDVKYETSLFHTLRLRALNPQTWAGPGR